MFSNKLVVAIFTAFVAFGFTACSFPKEPNQVVYAPEHSVHSFSVANNSVLRNPPENKARIYALRESRFAGSGISYNIFYQYEPRLDSANKLIVEKAAYKDNTMGMLKSGTKFYKDFEVGKPLLLIAGTERNSYLIFTPKENQIYCIEGTIEAGNWAGRPNLKFIDKARCETLYLKTKPKELY